MSPAGHRDVGLLCQNSPVRDATSLATTANHSQGWRAVGGSLTVSEGVLEFRPGWVERLLRGRRWCCRVSDIVAIDRAPPKRGQVLAGGSAWRLRLTMLTGEQECFVVSSDWVDALRRYWASVVSESDPS